MSRNEEFHGGRDPLQPHFEFFTNSWGEHNLDAIHPETGEQIGNMAWDDTDGEVARLNVHPGHRRRGVATALWNEAHRRASSENFVPPAHSSRRSKAGDAWAKKVGGELPPLKWEGPHQ